MGQSAAPSQRSNTHPPGWVHGPGPGSLSVARGVLLSHPSQDIAQANESTGSDGGVARVWEELARVASRDARVVETEAAAAWVLCELATIDREICEYARRYGASSPEDLDRLIRDGKIPGHPSWEDSLDWANLLAYRERLLSAMADVPRSHDNGAP